MSDEQLGELKQTHRGFAYVEFSDDYGETCSIQCSSACEQGADGNFTEPGTAYLWLGPDDAKPKILATKAAAHGIETDQTCGWIPYPVPDDVLLTTRMHLGRDQVRLLADRLNQWLKDGTFS